MFESWEMLNGALFERVRVQIKNVQNNISEICKSFGKGHECNEQEYIEKAGST